MNYRVNQIDQMKWSVGIQDGARFRGIKTFKTVESATSFCDDLNEDLRLKESESEFIDLAAVAAMQSLMRDPDCQDVHVHRIAELSYSQARAMAAERRKK